MSAKQPILMTISKGANLTFSVEAAPQFLMGTADTLEAHAPGGITTFTSSDRDTETQAHGCLGMTTHHPAPKKQCSTTLQDSDSRQSPARESQTLHTHPVISLHSCNTQCIPLHPQNSVEQSLKALLQASPQQGIRDGCPHLLQGS